MGNMTGIFSMIDYDDIVSAANTNRVNAFVNIGQQEYEYPINKGTFKVSTCA